MKRMILKMRCIVVVSIKLSYENNRCVAMPALAGPDKPHPLNPHPPFPPLLEERGPGGEVL